MTDKPSLDTIIRDVGRELGMRRTMYPKWIAAGRMKQDDADQRLACADALYRFLKENRAALSTLYERTADDTLPSEPPR